MLYWTKPHIRSRAGLNSHFVRIHLNKFWYLWYFIFWHQYVNVIIKYLPILVTSSICLFWSPEYQLNMGTAICTFKKLAIFQDFLTIPPWIFLITLVIKSLILTAFMSIPLVYDHSCWKYSSSRCLRGFGIWWKRMNSRTLIIWAW